MFSIKPVDNFCVFKKLGPTKQFLSLCVTMSRTRVLRKMTLKRSESGLIPPEDSGVEESDKLALLLNTEKLIVACADMQGRRNNMEDCYINARACAAPPATKQETASRRAVADVSDAAARRSKRNRSDKPSKSTDLPCERTIRIFAVCDGHGGSECSLFLSQHLAKYVSKHVGSIAVGNCKKIAPVRKAIQTAFAECESAFEEACLKTGSTSGSTCCMLILFEKEQIAFIANCGDSRAVSISCASDAKQFRGKLVTRDHSPADPDEKNRIEESGGFVMEFGHPGGVVHRVNGSLSVSRSFGDVTLRPHIIEDPDVYGPFDVRSGRDCAFLLACDGAFEANTTEELMTELALVVGECAANDTDGKQAPETPVGKRKRDSVAIGASKRATDQAFALVHAVRTFAYARGSYDNVTALWLHFP